jgi:protein-arginine kinase activator protein McsA
MTTERFCIHCGNKNQAEARFCQYCGQPIPQGREEDILAAQGEAGSVECPYCGQQITPTANVTQLVCLQCAAAFSVVRANGRVGLEILRF